MSPRSQNTERRGQFLSVALQEFVARGFHGTSTRSISAAAETSPGLLFHYFDSKQALYDELVALGCEYLTFDHAAALDDPLAHFEHSAAEALAMVRANPETALMFTFMTAAQRSIGVTERSAELLRTHDVVAQSVPVIEAGQSAGSIRPGDPLALSVAFWGAIAGIVEELGLRPDVEPQVEWVMSILTQEVAR